MATMCSRPKDVPSTFSGPTVEYPLLPGALNGTWEWVEKDLTLLTVPEAGHFVQQDAADLVSRTIKGWLTR